VADAEGVFFAAVPGGVGGQLLRWGDLTDIVELGPQDMTPRGRRAFAAAASVLGDGMQLKLVLAREGAARVRGGPWVRLRYRYTRSLLAGSLSRPERTIVEALPVASADRRALVEALRLLRDDPAARARFADTPAAFLVEPADADGTPRFVRSPEPGPS
jgi:hypothetical protein